jgi:hypothetical protein
VLQQLLALQLQLRQLQQQLSPYQMYTVNEVSMTHLTTLTAFTSLAWPIGLPLHLPTQLQTAQLCALFSSQLDALFSLQQLQRLCFVVMIDNQEPLLRLTQLPALQELSLSYEAALDAATTAPVWRQLPQLLELCVGYDCNAASVRQLARITAAAAAATGLTKLQLIGESSYHDEPHMYDSSESDSSDDEYVDEPESLCSSLARLPLLRDLSIIKGLPAPEMPPGNWLAADGVRALTVLTGLTRLVLVNRDGWFDAITGGDLNVAALVRSLTHLQELQLESCDTYRAQCMAAIDRLTQLTRLRLADPIQWPDEASQQGLLLLSGLSSLRRLQLCSVEKVAGGVLNSLRASLPEARIRWYKWVDESE